MLGVTNSWLLSSRSQEFVTFIRLKNALVLKKDLHKELVRVISALEKSNIYSNGHQNHVFIYYMY